jgi:hypothetical protein
MWQGNIITVPKEIGLEGVKLIHLARDRDKCGLF